MTVPVIGLTGGIGSGKSAAADAFAAHGAAVVDTDAIAHRLTAAGGAALPVLAATFGPAIIAADGALDRAAMRQRVFADPSERQRLESILHPLIRQESDRQVAVARTSGVPYVILAVPLLVESGTYRERVDRIVVVDCTEATQIARVMARNGFSEHQVRAILAAQASRSDRLTVADEVVDNDGDLAQLQEQIARLDRKFRSLSA